MSTPLVIDYYTDILCVWGWVAQRRIDELNRCLGNKIDIRHHYIDIFGDAVNKIPTQWHTKGGYEGFSAHIVESAAPYEYTQINTNIWSSVKPTSSANPHLVLKAIKLSHTRQDSVAYELKFRQAFFIEAQDISNINVLFALLDKSGLDKEKVKEKLADGSAMAALMRDYQQAKVLSLKGSPSYVLDNGRQTLYGNVGYRVLLANIEALINKPEHDASWC